MKTKETSKYPEETFGLTSETSTKKDLSKRDLFSRQKAMFWWSNLPDSLNNGKDKQSYYDFYKANFYTPATNFSQLTGKEIEHIWEYEVQVKELSNAYHNAEYLKPNQKQFKEFDESLFRAYINKFSNEDKFKAMLILKAELSE